MKTLGFLLFVFFVRSVCYFCDYCLMDLVFSTELWIGCDFPGVMLESMYGLFSIRCGLYDCMNGSGTLLLLTPIYELKRKMRDSYSHSSFPC